MITLTNAPTARTITATGYLRGTATQSSAPATMTETRPGSYAYTPPSLADGAHDFVLTDGGAIVGTVEYYWRNGAEVTPGTLRDNIFTRSAHSAADVWAVATRTITDKAGFSLSAAGITAIWAETTRTLTGFGTLAADVWAATTRSLTAAVTTDSASREASKASTTGLATSLNVSDTQAAILAAGAAWETADLGPLTTLISSIPTTPMLASNYIAPDNSGIGKLTALLTVDNSKFTAAALSLAPTGSGGTGGGGLTVGQAEKLDSIPTDNTLAAITAAVNSASANVIAEGDLSWATAEGFNTVAPDNAGIAATRTAAERLTVARAAKLDTVAILADAALYKADLTGIALTTDLSPLATAASLTATDAAIALIPTDDLTPTLTQLLDLAEADEVVREASYTKLRRGTQVPVLAKTVTRVDENTVDVVDA